MTVTDYHNDNWQVIEQRTGSSATARAQFVWSAAYVDALVQEQRDTDANGTLDRTLKQPVAEIARGLLAFSHRSRRCRDSLVFQSILLRLGASVPARSRGACPRGSSAKGCVPTHDANFNVTAGGDKSAP